MGSTNYGDQTNSVSYYTAANASQFNKANYKLIPKGIYEGFTLSKKDNTTVTVSTGSCYAYDDNTGLSIRITTASTIDITVSSSGSSHYIVIRYDWADAQNNYADFYAVDKVSIESDDIVLGRVCYTSATMDATMDYTLRTVSAISDSQTYIESFKVTPQEPAAGTVEVSSGNAIINGQYVAFGGDTSGAISATTDGRIDLVCIDEAGSVVVIEGEDSVTPTMPLAPSNLLVVGSITRGAAISVVKGNTITQFNNVELQGYSNGNSIAYNISGNLDYDNLLPGIYYHDGTGVLSNNPASTDEVIIVVDKLSDTASTQKVVSLTNNISYFRSISVAGGTWSAWKSSVVINDLTTGGTTVALSAEQGKILNTDKMAKVGSPTTNNLIMQTAGGDSADAGYALDNTGISTGDMVVWDDSAKTLKGGGAPGGINLTLLGTETTLVSSGAVNTDTNYQFKCGMYDKTTVDDKSAVTRMWVIKITLINTYGGGFGRAQAYFASGATAPNASTGTEIIDNTMSSPGSKTVIRTMLVPCGTHNIFVDFTFASANTYTLTVVGKEIQFDNIVYSSIV